MNRRHFLAGLGLTAGVTVAGLWSLGATAGDTTPEAVAAGKRLVIVVLRGGMDGLAAVPPYGDPLYRRIRDDMALPMPGERGGILDLDGHFGLHPALAPLLPRYRAGELAIVHGVALPYRRRSHFDAQKLLENGTRDRPGMKSGWLNRAMGLVSGLPEPMAFSADVPLILRGEAQHSSINPTRKGAPREALYGLLDQAYADDPVLKNALGRGRNALSEVEAHRGDTDRKSGTGHVVGRLMAAGDGPRVAVLQMGGWDTHTQQLGSHQRNFSKLAKLLEDLRKGLGSAWSETAVVCVSEFGRTARANGTGGTDHGTGGAALIIGGAVEGGRVHGDFAGLSRLHENRDLMPTTDLRSVFKGVLQGHLGLEAAAVESKVFADSRDARAMVSLLRRRG